MHRQEALESLPASSQINSSRQDSCWVSRGVLFGLAVVALGLRLWVSHHLYVVSNDSAGVYLYQAQEILHGNWHDGLSTVFPPGYAVLVSLVALLHLSLEEAGKLVSVLCGGLLVIPVFLLGRRVYGVREAWVATVLTTIDPTLIGASRDAVSEAPFTLVLILTALAGERLIQAGSVAWALVTGALFGLGYLIRPEAIGFLSVLVAVTVTARACRSEGSGLARKTRGQLPWLGCVVAGFLLVALPYLVFLRVQTGGWGLTGKTMLNLLAHDVTESGERVDYERARYALAPDGHHLQIETDAQQNALLFVWQSRARQIKKYFRNASAALLKSLPQVINPIFWLLSLAALSWGRRPSNRYRTDLYLGSYFVFPLVFYPFFWIEPRYFVPLVPIAIIWASHGLTLIDEMMAAPGTTSARRSTGPRGFLIPAMILIISMAAWPVFGMLRGKPSDYPLEHKEAGQYLRDHGRRHARIMSRKAFTAFYAGGVPVALPFGSLEEVLAYADWMKVDYLVVDERYTATLRPDLRALLDEAKHPKGLTEIYSMNAGSGRRLVIFDLHPPAH